MDIPYLCSQVAFNNKPIGSLKVSYRRGISNPDMVSPPSAGKSNGFKIHYNHSIRGQGLDISVNGRIIETPFYPWPDKPNNRTNGLVGEVDIEGDAKTFLTKDGLNWSTSVLQDVKDALLKADLRRGLKGGKTSLEDLAYSLACGIPKSARSGMGPELKRFLESDRTYGSPAHLLSSPTKGSFKKPVHFTHLNESQRTAFLKTSVESALSIKVSSKDTWGVAGVPVLPADFVFDYGGKTIVFECKDRYAIHEDIYQVRRYWDGLTARGTPPSVGVIVSDKTRPEVAALADYIEKAKLTDEKGNLIKIRLLTWGQFKVPSRIKSGTSMPSPNTKKTQKVMIKLLSGIPP
jgi:hypothetical protein